MMVSCFLYDICLWSRISTWIFGWYITTICGANLSNVWHRHKILASITIRSSRLYDTFLVAISTSLRNSWINTLVMLCLKDISSFNSPHFTSKVHLTVHSIGELLRLGSQSHSQIHLIVFLSRPCIRDSINVKP